MPAPIQSGREDLNLRPPAPKAGALAKLSYAPEKMKGILTRFGKSVKPKPPIAHWSLTVFSHTSFARPSTISAAL